MAIGGTLTTTGKTTPASSSEYERSSQVHVSPSNFDCPSLSPPLNLFFRLADIMPVYRQHFGHQLGLPSIGLPTQLDSPLHKHVAPNLAALGDRARNGDRTSSRFANLSPLLYSGTQAFNTASSDVSRGLSECCVCELATRAGINPSSIPVLRSH